MFANVDASIRSALSKITRRQMAIMAGSGAALLATGAAAVIIRKRKGTGVTAPQTSPMAGALRDSVVGILESERLNKPALTWGTEFPPGQPAVLEVGFNSSKVEGYHYAQSVTAKRGDETFIIRVIDTKAAWQKRIVSKAAELARAEGWEVLVEKVRIVPIVTA